MRRNDVHLHKVQYTKKFFVIGLCNIYVSLQ